MDARSISLRLTALVICGVALTLVCGAPSLPTDAAQYRQSSIRLPQVTTYSVTTPSPRYEFDHTIYLYQQRYIVSLREERIRVWRSTDAGTSWSKVFEYADRYRAGGSVVVGLPAQGHETPTVFVRFHHGIPGDSEMWRSVDGGDSWEERTPPGWSGVSCTGPEPTNDPYVLFSACAQLWIQRDIGVDRSIDSGRTWERVWLNAGTSQVAPSPAFATDHTLFVPVQLGYEPPPLPKLIVSFDGGDTWQPRDAGLCNMVVNSIALSPDFVHDRTLFTVQNGIIFKSQDAGQSWLQVYAEDGRQCEDSTSIYSHDLFVSPNYAQDRAIFWLNGGVLYASYDDGLSWQRLTRSASVSNVAIRRSPAPDAALPEPAALAGPPSTGASPTPGLTTGYQVFLPLVMQRGPLPLPLTIFASMGTSNAPYRSDDGGVTWTMVRLPPASEVYLPLVLASP